ncbi:MAG: cupin domain-containing protein [Gammaproteobacteria bacterium]
MALSATSIAHETEGETADSPTVALNGDPPSAARTDAERRARYFSSAHAFNLAFSPVPRGQFIAEHERAFAADGATQTIAMDQSHAMALEQQATTPLILSRYLRINAGEQLATQFAASAEIYYVIEGSGQTTSPGEGEDQSIRWSAGDVFFWPGGAERLHLASEGPAVLWSVTNEPQLAFEALRPAATGAGNVEAVHYPSAEIEHQLHVLRSLRAQPGQAGTALIFAQEKQLACRNVCPSLTLAMNTLEPGAMQRAHVHNSVAVTLCVQGKGCYSMIDGDRVDWVDRTVSITPPGAVHSHHNDGPALARFLIVQDGGLHYHCRTMGFKFAD